MAHLSIWTGGSISVILYNSEPHLETPGGQGICDFDFCSHIACCSVNKAFQCYCHGAENSQSCVDMSSIRRIHEFFGCANAIFVNCSVEPGVGITRHYVVGDSVVIFLYIIIPEGIIIPWKIGVICHHDELCWAVGIHEIV